MGFNSGFKGFKRLTATLHLRRSDFNYKEQDQKLHYSCTGPYE